MGGFPKASCISAIISSAVCQISKRSVTVRAKCEPAWVTIWDPSFGELIECDEVPPEKRGRMLRNVRILLEAFVVQLSAEVGARGEQRCDNNCQTRRRQRINHPGHLLTLNSNYKYWWCIGCC